MKDGRVRAIIENVTPSVDFGRFPAKRIVGDQLDVEADIFTDGHDRLRAVIAWRHEDDEDWSETELEALVNDHWRGSFKLKYAGVYLFQIIAWVDPFETWRHDLARREDRDDIALALLAGADLAEQAASGVSGKAATPLLRWAEKLRGDDGLDTRLAMALSEEFAGLMRDNPDRRLQATQDYQCSVIVDRERARFSSWYELFPRSCAPTPGKHGTLTDCADRLPEIAAMGFNVVYLPPIHPVGRINRKGPNNSLVAGAEDPGSPWAIGAEEGGHKAIHPGLGTVDDFARLVAGARDLNMEIALDIAFQCAPDHPWVEEHPQWFRSRPDGSIQYAENPPKKYQDIYPINFETDDWQALWEELKSVFLYWVEQGVEIFRVDNPHTKPFDFWHWVITEVKRENPNVLFLSEAFARPRLMYRLAKAGFSQSYTYFTWRNTRNELESYLEEITQGSVREYFRPNFWPNTPDILHEYLQFGGRPAFVTRLSLAATLTGNYGMYGPAFELLENTPREPGSEEYLDSEKYQVRHWDTASPHTLKPLITRINRIRHEHPALQQDWNLRFLQVDNEQLIAFVKWSDDERDVVVTVVNLDPFHRQSGWVQMPLKALGLPHDSPYQMHDLLTGARYLWNGARNYVELNPDGSQAHVFHLLRRVHTEEDFDYFF